MRYPTYISEILKRFNDMGEEAYIVGGSVRDWLLGREPQDFDIAVSCLPERVAEIFPDRHVIPTGIKHGTVTVVWDGVPVEITTFRIDGTYTDSRHPDGVIFTDKIAEDLSRRDFTVNAMAYNDISGLVDIFGGREDISNRLIRAVGDPRRRFSEDALRILRAFRFSAQLGFRLDEDTLMGAVSMSEGLSHIARERIGVEFLKLICSPFPKDTLMLMKKTGILRYCLGDYVPSDSIIDIMERADRGDISRLGILLCETDGESAREIMRELRLSGAMIKGALRVRAGALESVTEVRSARIFLASMGVYAEAAVRASMLLGNSPEYAAELIEREKNTPRSVRDIAIGGRELAAMGIVGKDIGMTLDTLFREIIDGVLQNESEALMERAKKLNDK